MDEFRISDRVKIVGKNLIGTIAFILKTNFSNEHWLWVILDEPVEANSESYEGVKCFSCGMCHGIIASPCEVVLHGSSKEPHPNYLCHESNESFHQMDDFHINDRVAIIGKKFTGTIAFIGKTSFSKDLWLWVILDEPVERNIEIHEDVWYFTCGTSRGIFARPCQVKQISSIPAASNESSMKLHPNYLRYESLLKLMGNQNSYEKKSILQNDIALQNSLLPFSSPDEEVNLESNSSEVKPTSLAHSENYLQENKLYVKVLKYLSTDKEVWDIREVISKIHGTLNKVKDFFLSLNFNRVKKTTCILSELVFPNSSSRKHDPNDLMYDFLLKLKENQNRHEKKSILQKTKPLNLRDRISKTYKALNEVKNYLHGLYKKKKTQKIKYFFGQQVSPQESEGSFVNEAVKESWKVSFRNILLKLF